MALLRQDYSCRHQLIIWEIVLETNFSTLRSVCLNDRFNHSQHRFTSLAFDRWNRLGVRHQDIYSRPVDCTMVPWESLTLNMISLTLINGSHRWSVIKWFLPCSNSVHLFTWIESYFLESEMKTLGVHWAFICYVFLPLGCDGMFCMSYCMDPHCMMVAMLRFASVWHRSTLYFR